MDGIWLALLLGAAVIAVVLPTAPCARRPLRRLRHRRPVRRPPICASARSASPRCSSCSPPPACCAASRTPGPRSTSPSAASPPTPPSTSRLVYGAGLGIAGSAWGTVIAQCGMAAAYLVVVVRGARRHGASLRPDAAGIRACAQAGVPLLVRTLSLRADPDDRHRRRRPARRRRHRRPPDRPDPVDACWPSRWTPSPSPGRPSSAATWAPATREGARAACRRMVQWGIASGVVLGAAGRRSPGRCSCRCSPATRPCSDALLPALLVVALVPADLPASSSSSTAC